CGAVALGVAWGIARTLGWVPALHPPAWTLLRRSLQAAPAVPPRRLLCHNGPRHVIWQRPSPTLTFPPHFRFVRDLGDRWWQWYHARLEVRARGTSILV